MYLKSLELHGFKSFPDRTVLSFNSGATVIVGPNGSGKSNITDAMRWVLGELSSKNIRGSKMEDVIFAGSDDKKPMSFAEVSVTFDDSREPKSLQSPYDEVTVTRRYYRSGESEYFINRKKVRLKDINQLFMNTGIGREGYSIIGQGKIAEIISKKSDERRGVFEESAGITKFRYQKTESEKRLAETEANMERVGDIEAELASRITVLERDSAKAHKYLDLYGEKKKVDVSLWLYDSARLKSSIEKTEGDLKLSAHELEMAEDSLNMTSAKIERLYEQSHGNKEESRKNFDEINAYTKKLNECEADIKIMTKEKAHAEENLASKKALLDSTSSSLILAEEKKEEIKKSSASVLGEYEECEKKLTEIDGAHTEKEEAIGKLTEKLETLLGKQKSKEAELTDYSVRINVLENSVSVGKKRAEAINADIKKYEDDIVTLGNQAEDSERQIKDYREAVKKSDGEISRIEEENLSARGEYDALDAEYRKLHAEYDSLETRIAALLRMQEHFDGYSSSTKYVMSEAKAGRLSGIRGPLSYLIKVEPKYIVAIETSLGGALQNIVTDDEHAAKRAIEALKRSSSGRATFYPITTVKGQSRGADGDGLERYQGFVGWGDNLVSCDAEYKNIVSSLLGRVAVFDNLDNATEAAKAKGWKLRAVTLDGQQVNYGGSFTGGAAKRDSGMLSRTTQIDSLKKEKEALSKKLSETEKSAAKLRESLEGAQREIQSVSEQKRLIEVLIGTEEKKKSDAEARKNTLSELVKSMYADRDAIGETSVSSISDIEKMKEHSDALKAETEAIADERNGIAIDRGILLEELDELDAEANRVKIRIAELGRDREAYDRSLNEADERASELRESIEACRADISALLEKIKEISEESEKNTLELSALDEKITSLKTSQTKIDETGDEIETRINKLRKTEKEISSKKDIIFTAHSKNESRLASLTAEEQKLSARMWDDYELTYALAVKFADENDCHEIVEGEHQKYVSEQGELKGKIKALGHVNIEAIEEYNEVKVRYDHIKTQLGDLRASKEDLEKILSDIERDMKTIFLDAFGKINTYFGEVFRELFGGGHAEVILTDPENVLQSGIEINAAPPGKTIKNLNLLSGGEQAFIAIALMFALIKVNPSPFCIFDEIEAALDEVNVARVGRYVKKYTKEMQIIMISHRRGTMDIADTLYGVTMQHSGISKVFTLGSGESREQILMQDGE